MKITFFNNYEYNNHKFNGKSRTQKEISKFVKKFDIEKRAKSFCKDALEQDKKYCPENFKESFQNSNVDAITLSMSKNSYFSDESLYGRCLISQVDLSKDKLSLGHFIALFNKKGQLCDNYFVCKF